MSAAVVGVLTNTLALDNPAEGIIIGSETANTTGIEMLRFNTRATGNSVVINKVEVIATTSGVAPSALINAIRLFDGATLVGTEIVGTGTTTATAGFRNLNIPVARDATKNFSVRVDINRVDGTTVRSGHTALVGLVSVKGEDPLFNVVPSTGTPTGLPQHVYLAGPQITLVSAKIASVLGKDNLTTHGDGTITFRVTALGRDIVIPTNGVTVSSSTGQEFLIDGVLLSGALPAQRTITAGSSRTITASARVTAAIGSRARLEITRLDWRVELDTAPAISVPLSLLHNLLTPSVIISGPLPLVR
ncbi:MAG: hypothetical protein DDT31_01923 [Syntrophomonadaceae bacterium]|nr:hypothetical protein [Bacillota bacterium]